MQRLLFLQNLLRPKIKYLAPGSILQRFVRHQAFEAGLDHEALVEARIWHKSFQSTALPKGAVSFSKSSGPGGQYINKTETKATTTWAVRDLEKVLPKLLHPHIRSLKYYSRRADTITIHAQTERSRTANMEENHQKLFRELQSLYKTIVPGETNPGKFRKYEVLKHNANEARLNTKKHHSSKKQFRRGSHDD